MVDMNSFPSPPPFPPLFVYAFYIFPDIGYEDKTLAVLELEPSSRCLEWKQQQQQSWVRLWDLAEREGPNPLRSKA